MKVSSIQVSFFSLYFYDLHNLEQLFDVGCVVSIDVLNQIAKTMGATNWTFGSDVCEGTYDVKQVVQTDPIRNITCDCEIENNTCHVTVMQVDLISLILN